MQPLTNDIELESQLAWLSTGLITLCIGFSLVLVLTTIATHRQLLIVSITITMVGVGMVIYALLQATNHQLTTITPPTLITQSDIPQTSPRNDQTPPTLKIDPDPEEWKDYADKHVSGETRTGSLTPRQK